jgi:hypothetical protein
MRGAGIRAEARGRGWTERRGETVGLLVSWSVGGRPTRASAPLGLLPRGRRIRRLWCVSVDCHEETTRRAEFVCDRVRHSLPSPPIVPRSASALSAGRRTSSAPLGRIHFSEHRFHGLRCARLLAGFASPVATLQRPFGADLSWRSLPQGLATLATYRCPLGATGVACAGEREKATPSGSPLGRGRVDCRFEISVTRRRRFALPPATLV